MRLFRRSRAAPPVVRVEPVPPAPPIASPPKPPKGGGAGVRSFAAARPDRLASGFGLGQVSPREELRREVRGLVQHSRHAAQNFDFARSYEMLFRRHVIGPNGIRLQMDMRDADDKRLPKINRAVEWCWDRWGRMGRPTVCGGLSWWGVQCVVATALAREGAALVRLHRGRSRGKWWFQVEPLALDLLDLDLTQPLAGGAFIESGIEFDGNDRTLAYHLWSDPPDVGFRGGYRRRIRVPADQIVKVLVPEEIAQALGIPRSVTALRLMNMSEKYQESAMAAAHYGAAAMVFFEQENASGELSGSADVTVPIDEIEAGTMAALPPGVKVSNFAPTYPAAAIEPFMRSMNTTIASGLGVSAETLTADLSRATFSALKAGKSEEREEWRMLQRAVFEGLHGRVFAAWLPAAIMSGQLPLSLDLMEDLVDAAGWRPRGWESVNPKDDAMAAEIELRLGIKSRREIVADRGRDFDDVCAERAADEEAVREYGLTPEAPPPAFTAAPAAPVEAKPTDAEGDPPEGEPKEV
ncbi:phage portal protein [Paenirhodobacter populi]|uniref:phage portal protein n=1 Tax=Paenirhodobacter populi TaxID=2306993 RepID=UPI000FE42E34|nr:phage portal protein [Sinirhodobacter populi]RWR09714.1 phage portal protein [Sinirhodobacter populi]